MRMQIKTILKNGRNLTNDQLEILINLYDSIGEGPTNVELEQLDRINKKERLRTAFDLMMEEEEEEEEREKERRDRQGLD